MISLRLSIHYIAEARQAVGSILFLPDLADMSTAKSLIQSYTFIPNESGGAVDDAYLYRSAQDEYLLVANGAKPTGLGARDTLRLEPGLPLYGHELGQDPEGSEIPLFACALAKFCVSFSEWKRQFVANW